MSVKSWGWNGSQFGMLTSIPVEDRGFRYGMSAFETVAVARRKAILNNAHLDRLQSCAARFAFPIDPSALFALCDFLKCPPLDEGLLRIHWTAGDGGPADPITQGRLIVRSQEMPLPGSLAPMEKLSLILSGANLTEEDSWKTGNYLKRCRLIAEAHKRGGQEALLYRQDGAASRQILGAVMANVFLVTNSGMILTPVIRAGCRNGTVREWIIQAYNVEERDITFDDIVSAKELILTNSRLGVASVGSLEGKIFEKGEVTRNLEESYKKLLLL